MSDWNTQVMEEFRANSGKVAQFGDAPMVILHTVGAKSGKTYEIPLVTLLDGKRMVLFASKAGAPRNPAWYHNLKANPRIDVEYGDEKFAVDVAEIYAEDRDRCFADQIALMPQFAGYVTKAAPRVIPVLAMTRVS
ncbi:MAG: nitroreductase family deazaflavin-dependent oxidoreductase [Chromatiales bacterium]|nr:nitroreductase family deazaflavin-dependent oxidoreductase [Chromatiales bacterium]